MRQRLSHKKEGMTLVELVVYIGIVSLILVVIMSGVVRLTSVFNKSRAERRVSLAAETVLERVVREIRLASSIIDIADPDPRSLELGSYVGHTDQTPVNKKFYCSSLSGDCGQIMYDPNTTGGASGDELALTPTGVTIKSLAFRKLYDNGQAQRAIRIEMRVESGNGTQLVSHTYYATAVLRGSYRF